MTLDEHFKSNAKILKNFNKNKNVEFKILGPHVWTHEVCSLEKGLYKPKGLLQLPFVVENTEYGHQLYSFFDKRFITGEGVIDPEDISCGKMMDSTSWENHQSVHNDSYSISVPKVEIGDILTGVNTLMQKYFELRKDLKSNSVHFYVSRQSYDLFMNCFTEYK